MAARLFRPVATGLLALMLTAALACEGVAPVAPTPSVLPTPTPARRSDCASFPCVLTGTVAASSEAGHYVELAREGNLTVRLVWSNTVHGSGIYLYFCQGSAFCHTSYELWPYGSFTLSMAANGLRAGDAIEIAISNSGPSIPYRLEIDWEP